MTTPNDENFDLIPNDALATGLNGPRTLGSFVVEGHRTDAAGADGGNVNSTHELTTVVNTVADLNLDIGSGKALGLNYGQIYTADWWQFRSTLPADNFKLASLQLQSSSNGYDNIITVSGYNDSGLAVSATVNLTASGTYGAITYVKLGAALVMGGTLTFGAGWGNIDTVRFAGEAGHQYGTQLWIDDIDVSAAAAITSAAYDAASGVLTVAAASVSAGESIDASKLTLTGQGNNSYTLTSGAVTAGADSFSITLNAGDKLFVNGLLNKNLGAADDGTSFNLAGAAGWNSTSGAEIDGTSPVSVSNVTTPSISSASYDAATGTLVVTGSAFSHAAGAANDIVAGKLSFTGQGGATYTLTNTANVEIASATSFTLVLSATDRGALDLLLNKNGSQSNGGTTYNLAMGEDWAAGAAAGAVVADVSGNAVTVSNVVVDTTAPTATLGLGDSALKIGDTALVTITFSEAVVGFTNADLTIANGTLGAVASSDGGVTWSATFTPTAAITDATNVITLANTGVSDAAGNAGVGSTNSANYAIDTQAPTAAIVVSDSALAAGESATVTITFSEAVSGLTLADLSAGGGALSALSTLDGGVTWTATLTPSAATTGATNVVTLAAGSLADLAGNPNAGATSSANYAVDTLRPSASVTLSDSALSVGETATVTITFSEAVTGFTNADLTIANGTLGAVASSDGGVTWTATFTPTAGITDATNVVTLDQTGVSDSAGNAGLGAASSANFAIDTARPTATVGINDSALSIGETATVTITFSEAVSGFTGADLTVANGTLGAVASSDGGVTWSATFTPAAAITDAGNVITLDQTGVSDAAGNAGLGAASSINYAIDTAAPTAAIVLSDSALVAGESATVTLTFSEAVAGLTLADLSAGAGSLSALASLDGGVTWTATLTPLAATASAVNLVTLAANSLADLAGNTNAGAASSASYSVQTVRPTASVTLSDSALKAGETSIVTIVFSEAVNGFSNADLSVANGTLAPVASNDGGVTWSATFTPSAGTTAAANTITLDNPGVTNGAGNAGSGATSSANYAIDTARPTAVITISDRTLTMGETATVTITFSEAVSGFTNADLAVEHGALGAPGSSDGGVTWLATFTPDEATRGSGAITLATSGVVDLAGNAGDTQAVSSTYSVNTKPPVDNHAANIDGAPSTSVTVTDPATGLAMVTLTVPVTLEFDPAPSLGKPGVADIPLGVGPTELVVRLPVGAGLVAEGPTTLLTVAQATTDLIHRIDGVTDAGSSERQEMRAQAHSFLDGLLGRAVVETRTLNLSSGTAFPSGQAIEIVGSAKGSSAPGAIALVIDTGALRPDIVLELDNVDFAAIIGAATIRGGAGRNQLIGNHAAQNFSLGEGDDFGAGGGGNDLLAGGVGNDVLLGGLGNDVLQGGRSDRGDWAFDVTPAGVLVGRHATAAFQPGDMEKVTAAELNGNTAGLGFVGAKTGQLVELALLYDAAFGRAPDLGGLEFYARGYTTAGAVMKSFFGSSEWLGAANDGLSDSAFLLEMYHQVLRRDPDSAGFAFWLDALAGKAAPPLARADFLTQFALSLEHRTVLAGGGDIVVGVGTQAREGDWFAHSGDDRLAGGPGNDTIVGGDGVDTLVYSGKLDDYRFLLGGDGQLRVEDKASGDLDIISGIEKGEFSDGTIGLSFTQADPKALQGVALMYQVVLDRAADADGFVFWLGSRDNTSHMASMFVESAEFVRHYGKLDDAHFVATLLANSGVAATGSAAAGWETWLGAHSRAELVVALIGDPAVTNVQFGTQGLWLV